MHALELHNTSFPLMISDNFVGRNVEGNAGINTSGSWRRDSSNQRRNALYNLKF